MSAVPEPTPADTGEQEGPAPPVRPTWKHKLLLVAFGLALAVLVELALRLAGFGGRTPLLHPIEIAGPPEGAHPGARLYEIHPRVADIFFTRRGPGGAAMVGSHRRELVVLPKAPGTLRVVFVGASTVEGFPLPRNLTSSRFLERMLRHAVRGRRVEVINLGVTAVASFPIRKLAMDALEQLDPDLLLVYEAHNEFFGASGMASRQFMGHSVQAMELIYRLRQLAVVQAFEALAARGDLPPGTQREQMIQVMAAIDEIPPGGELHAAARRSLEENYRAIVREARDRGVPVVLSTVASNERDLAPIASFAGDLPPERRTEWARRLSAAQARRPAEALEAYARLVREAPRHAGAAYGYARALEAAQEKQAAAEMYRRARDLDAMPWRASRDKNQVMRRLAKEEGTPLADCEGAFARASLAGPAAGATTWELFLDHVHPSLRGQALLARVFLEVIARERLLPLDPERLASLPDWQETAFRLGSHPLERYALAHKMAALFRVPPLASNNEAAAEQAERFLRSFRASADPVDAAAISLWEQSSREAGFALPISYFSGVAALRQGQPQRAAMYLHAATENAFPYSDERCAARLLAAVAALNAGEEPQAFRRRLQASLQEAEQVASLPGQPTALLAKCLAGLLSLAGETGRAARYKAEAREMEALAPVWQKPFLRGLPEPPG